MSRGLTEEPAEDVTITEIKQAFEDLAGYVGMLSVRLETMEDIIAKAVALNLPEEEAADRKAVNGL
jgi:hypothetical protein